MELFSWDAVQDLLRERNVTLRSAGLDEVPMAYKDIDVVMAAQSDLVEPLARFEPRLVKMAPSGEPPEDQTKRERSRSRSNVARTRRHLLWHGSRINSPDRAPAGRFIEPGGDPASRKPRPVRVPGPVVADLALVAAAQVTIARHLVAD